ncbi:hypothetical protein L9F63_013665, partial [Diploptera punctata]
KFHNQSISLEISKFIILFLFFWLLYITLYTLWYLPYSQKMLLFNFHFNMYLRVVFREMLMIQSDCFTKFKAKFDVCSLFLLYSNCLLVMIVWFLVP